MEPRVSTIVIERQALVREGLVPLLSQSSYRVIATASDITQIFALKIAASSPVLVIIRADDGYHYTEQHVAQLRAFLPKCRIVMVMESASRMDLDGLLRTSVEGWLLTVKSRELLLKSLDLALLERIIVVSEGGASSDYRTEAPCAGAIHTGTRA